MSLKKSVENRKKMFEEKLNKAENQSEEYIKERIKELEEGIEKTEDIDASEGNISVNKNLFYLKRAWEEKPSKMLEQKKNKYRSEISKMNNKLEDM